MLSDESDESDAANICRRPHNVVLERILQLEQQQQQQQQQVHPNGTALADTEKGITSSVSDPLADLQPVLEGETAVQPVTCSAGASVQAAQQAPQHQSRIAVCAATGSRNAARASQSQQHTRALRVFRDPFELAAINLSAPATNPSRPPRHPFAPAANPSGRPPNPQIHSDPTGVPFATKVGSLFTLYCLFEAQPIAPSGKVPIYLPLQLLLQLLPFLKEAQEKSVHDVGQVMMQLMKKNAFVVGAVRRPVRGSKAAEAAAQPPCRLVPATALQKPDP